MADNVIPLRPADSWPWKKHQWPKVAERIWRVRWVDVNGRRHAKRVKATERHLAELAVGTHEESFYDLLGNAVPELTPSVPKDAMDLAIGLLDAKARDLQTKGERYAVIGRGDYWLEQAEKYRAAMDDLVRAMVEVE